MNGNGSIRLPWRFSLRTLVLIVFALGALGGIAICGYPYARALWVLRSADTNSMWLAQLRELGDAGRWAIVKGLSDDSGEMRVQCAFGMATIYSSYSDLERVRLREIAETSTPGGTAALAALLANAYVPASEYTTIVTRLKPEQPAAIRRAAARACFMLVDKHQMSVITLEESLRVDDTVVQYWLLKYVCKVGPKVKTVVPVLQQLTSSIRIGDDARHALRVLENWGETDPASDEPKLQ